MVLTPIEVTIENLLNKAMDKGATEAEREAFMAAAQAKASRRSIDIEVMKRRLREKQDNPESATSTKPISKSFEMGTKGDRGAGAYTNLFWYIAMVNDLRLIMNNAEVTAYGMEEDIDIVHSLYQVVVVQMVEACNEYIDSGEWRGQCTRAQARSSFFEGYSRRIQSRLEQAKREALNEADNEHGSGTSALVLRDKKARVNEFYDKEVGRKLGARSGNRITHLASGRRGSSSADNARLASYQEIGNQRGIE